MEDVILTVQQLADREGVDYQTASGLLRYLREKGIAKEAGTADRKAGKGRAASTYVLPAWWVLSFSPAPTEQIREAA